MHNLSFWLRWRQHCYHLAELKLAVERAAPLLQELHLPRARGKERIIAAFLHANTGEELGAALAHNDHTGLGALTGKQLDAQALGL